MGPTAEEYVSPNEGYSNAIWHTQSQTRGTWSFDIYHNGNEAFGTLFYFIGNGQVNPQGYHLSEGYAIHILAANISGPINTTPYGNIGLDYVQGGSYQFTFDEYKPIELFVGWFHFEIIRNDECDMAVYLNNTRIIDAIDNQITSSENINIQTDVGVLFDNFEFH